MRVRKASGRPAVRTLSGVWDWTTAFRVDGGDLRAEQEVWFLTQKGRTVTGRYRRYLTRISMDGRVFGCNGAQRYTLESEFVVQGSTRNDRVLIQEKSYRVRGGSCETGKRRLDAYAGRLEGDRLRLYWGTGHQILVRRNLTGVWTWSRERLNRGGDTEAVTERWHVTQAGFALSGVRYRSDLHVSNDQKRYRCNSRLRMSRLVQWPFSGRIDGASVNLTFADPWFKPTPCDRRKLTYTRGVLEMGQHPDRLQAVLPEGRFELERLVGAKPGRISGPGVPARPSAGGGTAGASAGKRKGPDQRKIVAEGGRK